MIYLQVKVWNLSLVGSRSKGNIETIAWSETFAEVFVSSRQKYLIPGYDI